MPTNDNWVKNPSRNAVLMTLVAWFVGVSWLLLSMSNFFKESPFQSKSVMLWLVIVGATSTTIWVCRNYFNNKKG